MQLCNNEFDERAYSLCRIYVSGASEGQKCDSAGGVQKLSAKLALADQMFLQTIPGISIYNLVQQNFSIL